MPEKLYMLYITLHTLHSSAQPHEEYVEYEVYAVFSSVRKQTSGVQVGAGELVMSCALLDCSAIPRLCKTQPGTGEPAAYCSVPNVRFPLSELNRSPAHIARDAGGAPAALAPVRGCAASPASAGPASRPNRLHPVPGREKHRAAQPEHADIVCMTERIAA